MVKIDDLLDQYSADNLKDDLPLDCWEDYEDKDVVDEFLDDVELNDLEGEDISEAISNWASDWADLPDYQAARDFADCHSEAMTEAFHSMGSISDENWDSFQHEVATQAKRDTYCNVLSEINGGLMMNLAASELKKHGIAEISNDQTLELDRAAKVDHSLTDVKKLVSGIVQELSAKQEQGMGGRK